jgi:hypothetical protein
MNRQQSRLNNGNTRWALSEIQAKETIELTARLAVKVRTTPKVAVSTGNFSAAAIGPTLPSAASAGHGSYQGISCRLHPSISNAIASRGDCGQNDPSLASALGAISDSSAHFIAAATGATDRNLPSRHFPCRAYGDPYLFVDRDVRGFARGTRS